MNPGFGIAKTDEEIPIQNKFDRECSIKLSQAATKLKKLRSLNIDDWCRHFWLLRKDITKEEITTVLDWYIAHIKDEYVPKVYSAKKFRTEFHRITEAMTRSGVPTFDLSSLVISEEAKRAKLRYGLDWPRDEEKLEIYFIQLTINNYHQFELAIKSVYEEHRQESVQKTELSRKQTGKINSADWRDTNLLDHLVKLIPHRSDVVDWFIKDANWLAWHVPSWKGDLLNFVFKPETEKFQSLMFRLVSNYSGNGSRWPAIWEQIKNKMSGI